MTCHNQMQPMLACRRVLAAIQAGRSPHTGSVRQALCAALGEEVTDFYRLMAVLEAQLATPQPTPGGLVGSDLERTISPSLCAPSARQGSTVNMAVGAAAYGVRELVATSARLLPPTLLPCGN